MRIPRNRTTTTTLLPRRRRLVQLLLELGIRRVGAASCRDLRQMRLLAELDEKRVFSRQVVRHGAAFLRRDLDDRLTRIEQLLGSERPRVEQEVGRLDE